ncbi:hypothetical protein [Staphylococcus aureus]|uniref:hypothetical protein n=1 Tax=Staphylococcus aureus TaxID=1280 RepID=UPI0039BE6B03
MILFTVGDEIQQSEAIDLIDLISVALIITAFITFEEILQYSSTICVSATKV